MATLCKPGTHRAPAEYAACKRCVAAAQRPPPKKTKAKARTKTRTRAPPVAESETHAAALAREWNANCHERGGDAAPMDWGKFKDAQRKDHVAKQIEKHHRARARARGAETPYTPVRTTVLRASSSLPNTATGAQAAGIEQCTRWGAGPDDACYNAVVVDPVTGRGVIDHTRPSFDKRWSYGSGLDNSNSPGNSLDYSQHGGSWRGGGSHGSNAAAVVANHYVLG